MALGDFLKTVFNPGGPPGINSTRLNNLMNKVEELDDELALLVLAETLIEKIKTVDGYTSGLVSQDSKTISGIDIARIIFGDGSVGSTVSDNPNLITKSGFYSLSVNNNNPNPTNTFLAIHVGYGPSVGFSFQIASNRTIANELNFRINNNDSWTNWVKIITSANTGSGSGLTTDKIPFATKTGTSAGTQGQAAFDANYLYLCTATNVWKRVALASF